MSEASAASTRTIAAALVASLVAPGGVAFFIGKYGLNVPVQDQWRFAAEVVDWLSGGHHVASLWAPFGPHRIVVPKAVMLALASLTGWDVRAEMWFDFGLTCAGLVLLADLARVTVRPVAPVRWVWTIPLMSTSLFSMGAWHGWTLGWMMNVYLAVFGGILCAWALGRFGSSSLGIALVLLGATIAVYSYLGALPLLILVPMAVALDPPEDGPRAARVVITAIVAAGVLALYFVGYPSRQVGHGVSESGVGVAAVVSFVVTYLGGRFGAWSVDLAFGWGCVATGLGAAFVATFLRFPAHRRRSLPWLLLVAYVVAVGLLTAAGRHAGPRAPLLSRFAMFPALFWAAVPSAIVVALSALGWNRAPAGIRRAGAVAAVLTLTLAGYGYARNWEMGVDLMARRHAALRAGEACLHDPSAASKACLQLLSRHSPELVRRRSGELAKLRVGPFRDPPRDPRVTR